MNSVLSVISSDDAIFILKLVLRLIAVLAPLAMVVACCCWGLGKLEEIDDNAKRKRRARLPSPLADISDADAITLTWWPDDRLDQLATADGLHRAYDWCELRRLDPWRDYSGGVERTDELYAWLDPTVRQTVVTEKIYAAQYNRMHVEKRRLAQSPKI